MVEMPHKIRMPQRPPELVTRPHLIDSLSADITRRKLVAVVAPAGYGKTALLIDLAYKITHPICWYTLDVYDADPWEFLRYLVASVNHRFPGSLIRTLQLLEEDGHQLNLIIATFTRELGSIPGDFIMCLDDWHLVDQEKLIRDLIVMILTRCPNIHILIASRTHPSLPNQMLLTARRQFVCMNETQLRFTAEELRVVIANEGITNCTADQAQWLVDQSEGWLTGVLLALQTSGGDISLIVANRIVMSRLAHSFLTEQVLDQQPPEVRQFLLESSMLEELTVEHCNRLLGRDDAWTMLNSLLRQRPFVREIAPGVLRQHPLFRELLQQLLQVTQPARFHALGLRVAVDFAQQGKWSLAFDLCANINDLAAAQRIMSEGGENLYVRGHLETLERAFAMLPPDALNVPLLCLKAQVMLDRGHIKQAQLLVEQALLRAAGVPHPRVKLLQAVIDRVCGRFELASAHSLELLDMTDDPLFKGQALRNLGISLHRMGQSAKAIMTLEQACKIEQERGSSAAAAQVLHELMVCYHAVSDMRAAEEAGRQAETHWTELNNIGRRALTRNSLAINQALTGHYHEAFSTAAVALRDAQDASIPQYEAAVLSTLGDIYADLGLWQRAGAAYRASLATGGTTFIREHVALSQIGLLIQQHRYAEAMHQLAQMELPAAQQHRAMLLLHRAQLAGGTGAISQGIALIQEAIKLYAAANLRFDLVRAWMVRAWLHSLESSPDASATLEALQQAADLSGQTDYDTVAVVSTRLLQPVLRRMWDDFGPGQLWLQRYDELCRIAKTLDYNLLSLIEFDAPPPPAVAKQGEPPLLRAHYLGGDLVWIDDKLITLGPGRPREVLAFLITHPRGASRAQLYHAIWSTDEPPDDPNALNRVIYRLRAALPAGAIITINRDTYCLDGSVLRIEVDAVMFEQLLEDSGGDAEPEQQIEAISQAIDLYQGVFLPHLQASWSADLRARLELRYRQALDQLARLNETNGSITRALELFRQLVGRDTTNIGAHAGIMRCYVAMQWPAQAIEQYRTLRKILTSELGIGLDPNSEPESLYQMILAS